MSRDAKGGEGRSPSLLESLSGPPEDTLGRKVRHHGSRVALLLLVSVALTLFFPPSPRMQLARYDVGMVADTDMIATIPFAVPKARDQLERERAEAAAAVPPTFRLREEAADSMASRLERFFQDVRGDPGPRGVLERVGIPVTPAQLQVLGEPPRLQLLEEASLRAARELLPLGVVDGAQTPFITTDRLILVNPEGPNRYVSRDSLRSAREFYDRAVGLLPPGTAPEVQELYRLILIRFLEPSYILDAEATERDRNAARRAVPTTNASILAGEAIVRANQQVGAGDVERILAYEEQLRNQGRLEDTGRRILPYLGSGTLNFLLLGIFGLLLFFYRREIYADFRWVLLQALLVLAYFGVGGLIARNGLGWELLPVAFPALAVAVLWDSRMALVLALILGVLTGVQPPYFGQPDVLLVTLMGGATAALSVRVVRRRAQTWIFIAIITLAYATTLLSLSWITGRGLTPVLGSVGWTALNATVSAILAMGFLPVFEWFTRITTDQTLLEWADPNRPLLKRLSLEAPGTYAHTINVANLAEAAATAVGANPLLCRVGVYYHDVGKMLKPQYFIENQPGGRNPHDKLKAATSAAIVKEHVTEGLRMAREAKLPEVVQAFIPEHHGTQLIAYFYDRAEAEAEGKEGSEGREDAAVLDPADFSYSGPRPRTRETAIVMLADTVESATRSLQDPTPARIHELVESLVESKIRHGQMDEAPLTLHEISVIKEQFAKVLAGMYHHRIDYPGTRHLTRRDEEDPASGREVEAEPTHEQPNGGASPDDEGGSPGETDQEAKKDPKSSPSSGEPDLFNG
ncbi:MAG: HDIG domain-containing metalloprotein [Gemmatimonadota bacterium]